MEVKFNSLPYNNTNYVSDKYPTGVLEIDF